MTNLAVTMGSEWDSTRMSFIPLGMMIRFGTNPEAWLNVDQRIKMEPSTRKGMFLNIDTLLICS